MSRGPGRIERTIRELFDTSPESAFSTAELVEHCYPGLDKIERKHQVAVLRAARKVVAADPALAKEYACHRLSWDKAPRRFVEFFRRDDPPTWVTAKRKQELSLAELRRSGPALMASILAAEHKRCPPSTLEGKQQFAAVADRARGLMVENDPDVVRKGLAEIAAALDQTASSSA